MTRALVAYASKYGSAEEVARYVAAVLRDGGTDCEVVAAGDVENVDDYDLIVLGTGLYMGRMHRDARRFLRSHHDALEHARFAVFAMGPLSNDPAEKEKVRPHLERGFARHRGIAPVTTAIFGGVIDPEKLSFPFSHMPAGDYRDWDEIRAFALSLDATQPAVMA